MSNLSGVRFMLVTHWHLLLVSVYQETVCEPCWQSGNALNSRSELESAVRAAILSTFI